MWPLYIIGEDLIKKRADTHLLNFCTSAPRHDVVVITQKTLCIKQQS